MPGQVAALAALMILPVSAVAVSVPSPLATPSLNPLPGSGLAGAVVTLVTAVAAWICGSIVRQRVRAQAARKEAEHAARILEKALASISEGVAVYDACGRLQLYNRTFAALFRESADILGPGLRFEDLIRIRAEQGLTPDAIGRVDAWVAERMERFWHPQGPIERPFPDGSWWQINEQRTADGGVAQVATDITRLKQREAALRASERQLGRARRLARLGDWRLALDTGEITWSAELYDILGVDPAHFEPGFESFLRFVHADDRALVAANVERVRAGARSVRHEYRLRRADGEERWVRTEAEAEVDDCGRPVALFGTAQDITEQKQNEAHIRYLAHYDPLTGLPNRVLFRDRLEQALSRARRQRHKVAVLQLDLDRFKDINDTLGHGAGDSLLCETAARLQRCVRGTDTVARLGGDEFALVLTDLEGAPAVDRVAQKIVHELARPVAFGEQTLHTTASIGITLYPTDGVEPNLLLKNADIALHQAKAAGRNAYRYFLPAMKEQVERRNQLEAALREALARDQFVLLFQPQVRLDDDRLCGFEALLRWRHPSFGVIGPGAFLAVADDAGLSVPIGELVLRRACAQGRAWLDAGLDPGRIGVNLGMAQFRARGLAATIERILEETGLPAERLELEITESVLMEQHKDAVFETLARLHQRGVTFALDDFGTGYASLSHLKQFPVDRLKIDRSFVRDIGADPDDAAIARAVINLGHSLDLEVVAEGVETEGQRAFLRLNGCDVGQGYLFARPLWPRAAQGFMAHPRARTGRNGAVAPARSQSTA